jgi:hypothetical protein
LIYPKKSWKIGKSGKLKLEKWKSKSGKIGKEKMGKNGKVERGNPTKGAKIYDMYIFSLFEITYLHIRSFFSQSYLQWPLLRSRQSG